MTDGLDGVRDHYRATGLTERLKEALKIFGPEDQQLLPEQLAALDQFHSRGLAATTELAQLAGITAAASGARCRLGRRRTCASSGGDIWLRGHRH